MEPHRLRHLDAGKIARLLSQRIPRLVPYTRLVGRWLWIEGASKPNEHERKDLHYLGFHWNRKRVLWQHPGGAFVSKASPADPRFKYGQERIDELVNK